MSEPVSLSKLWRLWVIHPVQAFWAYVFFILLRLLPLNTASNLGGWIGRKMGPSLGITRRARRNLERAFPDMSDADREVIVTDMWENLGRTFMEYTQLDRIDYRNPERVEIVGAEHLEQLKGLATPALFFTGHFGNWEILCGGIAASGVTVNTIYRAPNNRLMGRLFRHRCPPGGELIPKGTQGARRLLELIRAGANIAFAVDQKMNDGIAVPFFGRDAMTAPALAQFALKYDAPLIPMRCERIEGSRFRLVFEEPLTVEVTGERNADVLAIMTQVNAMIEDWIRATPGHWLWLHNRWPD